ncbi:MAG TPA: glycine C-acetyltransferase [bacterium]|nr:glycine C-acetyltransferase [bacterium]
MDLYGRLNRELDEKARAGLLKAERVLGSPQGSEIMVEGIREPVLNFCSNNYLGLANHPAVLAAVRRALEVYGFGLASVRFICGTQTIHKQLEERLADFLGLEDCLLYTSCFDANGGLFAGTLAETDTIVSARLNHASIIDGVRLTRCRRFTYREDDPADLERTLAEVGGEGVKLVMTDGVFSMEGTLAPLDGLAPVCRKHGALLAVDDSHATGFVGRTGRGTPEHFGLPVDIVTGTLGKALGGATGGFTAGRRVLIDWLRNTSRPYLFSNSLPPALAAGAIAALDVAASPEGDQLRVRLAENTARFRSALREAGFSVPEGGHPIVPVMVGDASLAGRMAGRLLEQGIYVISFSYPVVPEGKARIRVQVSALHTPEQLDRAAAAFARAGREFGLVRKAPVPVRGSVRPELPEKMQAWVYYNQAGADGGHLRLEEVAVPRPHPGELLLKVLGVTVCGTDEDLFHGKFQEVHDCVIPGHEIFGSVAALGSNVRGFEIGQKLCVESHYQIPGYLEEGIIGLWGPKIARGGYLRPLNGGYAEYVKIPTYCAHPIPEVLDHPGFLPSILEGVGNDFLIAKYLLDQGLLGTVGVVGCGPHGLFTQMFLRHFGVARLAAFEVNAARLKLAAEFGVDLGLDARVADLDRRVADFTGGAGFDVMVDIAGGQRGVLETCLKYLRDRGTLVLFGLYGDPAIQLAGQPINDIIFNQRELQLEHAGKRIRVRGITGREGIWDSLIDTVALSRPLQDKIMKLVTVMGTLEKLGGDTLALDRRRIMKRGYRPFGAGF